MAFNLKLARERLLHMSHTDQLMTADMAFDEIERLRAHVAELEAERDQLYSTQMGVRNGQCRTLS